MPYTFATDGDKEALLKRCYRRFQIGVATLIIALLGFLLACRAYASSHFGWVVAFTGLAVAFALWDRSRRKRDGIGNTEWQSYLWRQPMMILVQIFVAISVIVSLFRLLFEK